MFCSFNRMMFSPCVQHWEKHSKWNRSSWCHSDQGVRPLIMMVGLTWGRATQKVSKALSMSQMTEVEGSDEEGKTHSACGWHWSIGSWPRRSHREKKEEVLPLFPPVSTTALDTGFHFLQASVETLTFQQRHTLSAVSFQASNSNCYSILQLFPAQMAILDASTWFHRWPQGLFSIML